MSKGTKKMTKKKPRNKFRDMIGDYYMTNREISKQDKERCQAEQKDNKRVWSTTEKMMLITIILAGLVLLIKHLVR